MGFVSGADFKNLLQSEFKTSKLYVFAKHIIIVVVM